MPDFLEPNTTTMLLYLLVLVEVVGLALYDIHYKRVPNRLTFPLLLAGLLLHFPGQLETWFGCLLLFLSWRTRLMGAGDAKLWMALLWLTPHLLALTALLVIGASLCLTALVQLAWRRIHGDSRIVGKPTPAAWRTIPYALWLVVVGVR